MARGRFVCHLKDIDNITIKGGIEMAEFKYEIVERIAILSENGKWTKELNKVSWNGRTAKYDLRDWNHEDEKIGKGITLTDEEIQVLKETLDKIF
ncbi:MAG: hypothetical protein ACFWUA_01080 [Sporanaerobacter sp.]